MTQRPAPVRARPAAGLPTLSPLVLAILGAFPTTGGAQVARPAVPAPATVPVPSRVGWLVSTSAPNLPTPAPVSTPNGAGGTNLTINQLSPGAVYNWQSFDIGSASSVTFNYPSATSSSLNRVTGSTAPSAIFGALKSQYTNPDPKGAPLVGGSIYLVNANGILFGRTAQVDTGALVASTLDLQNADFYSGLSQSIASQNYSFGPFAAVGDTPASLLPGAGNFVLVDPGARITTPSGGRVFLFANNTVQNGGSITTPNGQTVLAAGDQVYLNVPTNEPMYASEVNSAIPAVNGLLVEVGTGNGSVANLQGGVINTPTGNTTLVGMAVNQSGRINATTSVSQDGSVFLLARGNAQIAFSSQGHLTLKEATTAGALTLGPGSVVDIEPDTTIDSHGNQATSNANSSFTPSLVQLSGKTVDLQAGSSIIAHGGVVDVRAERSPYYVSDADAPPKTYDYAAMVGDDARLVVDANATIDVSGTTNTSVSAARNFVTTALLGANDLADAPLQRSGPVYRSELTFDVRSAVPILGNTSAYINGIERTATEQLSAGGKIKLESTGAVITNASSTLDVSGGRVNYTAATVTPSQLLGSDGKVYTFNQAPAGLTYTGIVGAPSGQLDRWGVVPSFTPSQVSRGVTAPGYVSGQAGGTLSIVSPVEVLDGQINAAVTQGVRQTAGQDPLAAPSRLVLGARTNGSNAFGTAAFISAGLADLEITAAPGSLGTAFWSDPLAGALPSPSGSHIAASTLNASGLGRIQVTANGGVTLDAGADLKLPASAAVDLAAGGAGGIALDASIRAAGGTVSAQTRSLDGQGAAGGLTLAAGQVIDVSATWANRALDGATAPAATAGGVVALSSGGALDVQDASRIDVSGAATVGVNGKVTPTVAGSVTLQSGMSVPDGGAAAPVHLGAELRAGSLGGGGTLTISADSVTIGAGAIPGGVTDGAAVGSLVLSNAFFNQGAFSNYAVDAVSSLVVSSGTTIRPGVDNWILGPDAATRPTGSLPGSFMASGRLPDGQRPGASVQLDAKALQGSVAGDVTLASGASIVVDPLASVTLDAGRNLTDNGRITAPGGNVALNMVGSAVTPPAATLKVGGNAAIDVSGTVVIQPQTGALPTGQVLAGGNVTLAVASGNTNTAIVVAPGAVIAADGTTATVGVATTNAAGNVGVAAQNVSSPGGTITVDVGPSHVAGAVLAGDLHARGGDANVSGGSFHLGGADTVVVQQGPVTDIAPVDGLSAVTVSAQSLGHGFSNIDLQASGGVRFITDTTLAVDGNLKVDAPALVLAPGANQVALSGASTLQVGAAYQQIPSSAGAIGGTGQLSLSGGLVELSGQQVLQGVGNVAVTAASELRLHSLDGANGVQGALGVQGDISLRAPQVVPTSGSQFVLDASGQHVSITGGDPSAPLPLSAGGHLTINAGDIAVGSASDSGQAAVVRAPFGTITLNASDRLTVGSGSLLSVAGTGLTLPYGQTSGGVNWTYGGAPVVAPPAKSILLNAPSGAISVAAGATLDLSGGGNLVAQEFVPGNGGTKDIFAGAAGGAFAVVPTAGLYAAQDADILLHQPDAGGVHPTLQLGRTVTFGEGGPVAAGTYAVMPAQYATLAGAFLVTPTTSGAPLALGAAVKQADGSVLVGGRFGQAGTSFDGGLPQSFKVLTSTQALAYSEIDQANANTYFAAQAAAKGVPVPSLPTDAGVLAIAAGQLALKGSTLFTLPTVTTGSGAAATTHAVGRGGELDIAANAIQVGGTAGPDVLVLDPSDINSAGAGLVVLGGLKDASTGQVGVSAADVTVANAGTPLKVNDLVLVANDTVALQAGSSITATPPAGAAPLAAPTLSLQGDGALLRVSADASASSLRTGVQGTAGQLDIGAGVTLSGGALTLEGTHTNAIAGDAVLKASAITLAAGHLAVGDLGSTVPSADTLVLTPALAAQVAGAQSLTLRSATGLDLYGNAQLGGASVRSLTVDTGNVALVGDHAAATISAGGVTLQNTTGSSSAPITGDNTLTVQALGDAVTGSGQIVVGPGAVSLSGAGASTLSATHEVVLDNHGALATAGDLTLAAASLQGGRQAQGELDAGGRFTLVSSGTASSAGPGAGAQVTIAATSIAQQGNIVLPSGQLSLKATAGGDAVQFASGSRTDLSGRASQLDGITVATPGGTLAVLAPAGNVQVDIGSAIDVSAPAAGGHAGSVTIAAPTGSVALRGSLLGSAAAGQGGGSLDIDSSAALDLGALASTLAAAQNNFSASIAVRNRSGDQTLASGTALAAQSIAISADAGALSVAGRLDASGTSGTRIMLAGGNGVDIQPGAAIGAHSTGSTGSQMALLGGSPVLQADGTFSGCGGSVRFDGGSIDTSGAAGGSNGTLLVRALRGADGTGVAVGGSGTSVTGASQLQVESVAQYAATTVDSALIARVNADNQRLGTQASQTQAQVAALLGQPAAAVQLRSGVEIDSTGDLVVTGNPASGGWNLTSFGANGAAQAQASGAPMDVTLRAAGNLTVGASISDGFLPTGPVPVSAAAASRITPSAVVAQVGGAPAQGANITLVGGADLTAADVTRTQASADAGDVTIGADGKNVLVRSTTGNITLAAGRDVALLNTQAEVYTTGTPVSAAQLQAQGYIGNQLPAVAYLRSGTAAQSPFLTGGGSLAVTAGRDIVGPDPDAATVQTANAWTWRANDQKLDGQPLWWSRYDQFRQGFATLGGGNVRVRAGQDLVNANFASAASGFVARGADGAAAGSVSYGGGDVDVAAGRDIVGGGVMATGTVGRVQAGRDIVASASLSSPYALQVIYGNTALDIGALDDVRLGLVSPIGLTPPTNEYLPATAAANYMTILGLTPRATLDVQASAGDLSYDASSAMDVTQSVNAPLIVADRIVPDTTRFAAPGGSITAGTLVQIPAGTTKLSLLAHDSLSVSGISVSGTDPRAATPTLLVGGEPSAEPLFDKTPGQTPYDTGARSPMELVAQEGDVTVSQGIRTSTSLRMIAGRDILLAPTTADIYGGMTIQHQSGDELSLIQAGRDIVFPDPVSGLEGGLQFYGPGNLVVLAGRNIDLSNSRGVLALGNRQNAVLPSLSGNVTLAAGVSLAGGDYTQAAAWYFPLLGGTGVAGFAPDLYAQLSAARTGQALPALGGSVAQQFAKASPADQVSEVKTLVGDDVFNAAVLADAQRRAGDASLGLAQAQAAFAQLGADQQRTVASAALAQAWTTTLPAPQQQAQALAMAQAAKSPYLALLQQFVASQGGPVNADPAAALQAYEAMAPERQALLTNLVLVDLIRSSGRTASKLTGDAQKAAYQPAYDALDLVFPATGGESHVAMGSSQIETLQDSDLTILAPRGSVDVGTVAASANPKPTNTLGVVTAAGGNVSMVVGDSVNVDQSRVFTVGLGDLLMWASNGSLDAGRGGKTVVGAPAPVYRLDPQTGQFSVDLSGSFSGSGIAVLNADSNLDLYAPKGQINAGDAGIKSLGNAYFGAAQFVGADNLSVGGLSVGAPPPASTGGGTVGLAAVAQSAMAATTVNAGDSEEEKERKRRKRLNLVLEFLGFGEGTSKP